MDSIKLVDSLRDNAEFAFEMRGTGNAYLNALYLIERDLALLAKVEHLTEA